MQISFNYFSYVNKFIYFLFDFVLVVAKVTKFVQEYHISNKLVSI